MRIVSERTTSQEGCATIHLRPDGIVECIYKPQHITLQDAQQLVQKISEYIDAPHPVLADISVVPGIDRAARVYFATSEENLALTKCVAFVTNQLVSRGIGDFFLGLNRPGVPTKLFGSREQAIAWLGEQRDG